MSQQFHIVYVEKSVRFVMFLYTYPIISSRTCGTFTYRFFFNNCNYMNILISPFSGTLLPGMCVNKYFNS